MNIYEIYIYIICRDKIQRRFPPFNLPRSTFNKRLEPCALTTAVQSVVEPFNTAIYLCSKNPYLHSISRTSYNSVPVMTTFMTVE